MIQIFLFPQKYVDRNELLNVCFYLQDIQKILWPQRTDCVHEYSVVPSAHLLPTYYLSPETQALGSVHCPELAVFVFFFFWDNVVVVLQAMVCGMSIY